MSSSNMQAGFLQVVGEDFSKLNPACLAGHEACSRLGKSLLVAHSAGLVPDSITFQHFKPTVLVGRHQVFAKEAREAWCLEQGIAIIRRETAGGALYMDEGHFAFHLVVPTEKLGTTVAERLENGASILSKALLQLGVKTSFKPPNDLQIAGRQKIGSVFLADQDGSTLLFATVIADLDLKSAMQALLVPTEKLTVTGLEHARERMTSLAELLGAVPSPAFFQSTVLVAVREQLGIHVFVDTDGFGAFSPDCPDMERNDWAPSADRFETKDKVAGATLRLILGVSAANEIVHARFSTDGHISPADTLERLGHHLEKCSLGALDTKARSFLEACNPDCAGFEIADVVRLIERAVAKRMMQVDLGLSPEQTSGVMLAGSSKSTAETLEKASVMLVPYCAKPSWCKWRHTIDCVECGKCEVGDAYIMARERNMEVVTITNFEHLSETLGKMKQVGVESYVGMCCGEFFLKRHHAFRDSGMDAVLLDIEGATCYELKEEHLAYAGAFKAEANLDIDAVGKVLAKVPVRPASERPRFTGLARRPGERKYEAEENRKRCGGNCNCSVKPSAETS